MYTARADGRNEEVKKEYTIIVDTREQEPLYNKNTIRHKLEVGDYSLEINGISHENKIAIERKSLPDLFQTLTHGHARFKKELTKARTYEYFAILIEGTYTQIQNKDYPGSYHTRMKGYVINKILFTLHVKYGINVIFGENKIVCRQIINNIFESYINKNENLKKTIITQ